MSPEQLSELLRTGDGLYLALRRGIVVTSFVAGLCMMLVGVYQMGLIRHLPEPPLPRMNADKVDAAGEAYNRMSLPMPDAFLGLISYAVTAALASLAGPGRVADSFWWWVPVALLAKVGVDAVQAAKLSWEQWAQHGAFCFWCLVAALATFIAVPLAVPEGWAALRRLFGQS